MPEFSQIKVLVLGSSGMLGSAVLKVFGKSNRYSVFGTIRSGESNSLLAYQEGVKIYSGVDAKNPTSIREVLMSIAPDVVINCIGLVKQLPISANPIDAIMINSLLPNHLESMCDELNIRLIHISTDCVFSGNRGDYVETDFPDSNDIYGRTKYLGELKGRNSITLRTSIIGHELHHPHSLVDWFLMQEHECLGYVNAIFSGMPTVYLAEIIRDYVLPNSTLSGLYHISSQPISKYDLLRLISEIYNKDIKIKMDYSVKINRSLNGSKFKVATKFNSLDWKRMIQLMHSYGR